MTNNIKLGYIENEDRLCTTLRLLRHDSEKSLRDIAPLVDLSVSTLSNMERGATRMPSDVLMKLLHLYGVRMKLEESDHETI